MHVYAIIQNNNANKDFLKLSMETNKKSHLN